MVLAVLAPQDTQPAWVAGPEQERQKMQPQLVMTILAGPDWGEAEDMPAAHLLQCTQNRCELWGWGEVIMIPLLSGGNMFYIIFLSEKSEFYSSRIICGAWRQYDS